LGVSTDGARADGSWTEPIILGLIILYGVTLVVQSATTLNEPRARQGYFHGWEDVVILVVFAIFTCVPPSPR
jgi:hypothetical protein